jgi:hypothetical protein
LRTIINVRRPNRRRTVLKQAFKIARRGFTPHCNVGRNSDPADQLADDLAHPLDTAGEILAICLDYADAFVPEPGDPPLGVELEQVRRTRAS